MYFWQTMFKFTEKIEKHITLHIDIFNRTFSEKGWNINEDDVFIGVNSERILIERIKS